MPMNLEIIIPSDEPVRLLSAVTEELDYRRLTATYSRLGRIEYSPRLLFKIVLYGCSRGIYKTRELERACRENVNFMYLLEGHAAPDHNTIARFRKDHLPYAVENLLTFIQDCISKKVVKNTGQLPMYLIQNNHPAIVSREVYQAVQAEKARRSATASPSTKTSSTGRTCYASKFALSERLVCGECGTLYRRCTWKRNGKTRIVWRCVSRLDYGTKYCHQSPTMDEEPLQRAILAAISSVMAPKEKINGLITDAALEETGKLPNSAMTLGDINRRLEKLEAEFDTLFNQSGSIDKNVVRFSQIANEMASLKEQRERISAQLRNSEAAQKHVHTIAAVLDQEDHRITQWDEEMIRQLVHTVKVISTDHIRVYLNDGTEIDQTVGP